MTDPTSSPTTGPTPCRDPEFLQAYLHEQLDERDEARVQEHVGSCADCQSALAAAAGDPALWREVEVHMPHEPADGDAESEAVAAGQTLAELREHLAPSDDPAMLGRLGHYEIRGVIGSGSTGIVLKAWEPRLDRYVAIKLMLPGYRASAAARRRFGREARAVAAVAHEHVVPIYSVDEYRGLPYIVMKYVPGESLQQRLDRTGPLDSRAVVRVGVQVARALAAAHAQGIVHRDVKPANVILDDNVDRAMVTDFGLARVVDEVSLTHSGTITGTPQFMSPEQARGDVVDPRSDLFSLGSLLYAASTGQPPFRAQTLFGVIHRVSESEPRPLRELNPEIDEVVAELVGRLMQKQPDARFQTATAAADGLEAELAWLQNPTSGARPPRDWRGGEPVTSRAFGSRLLLAAMTVLAGAAAWWLLGTERESGAPSGSGSGPSTAAVFGWQDPANGAQWTRRAGTDGGTPVFEQRVTRSIPIVAGGKLQVRIESGDVVVLPAAGADVRVEVIRRFATNERAAAEQLARLHAFSAAQDGDAVTLTGAFDAAAVARRGRGAFEALHYHVTVPAGVALELESAHGRIEIGDLTGDVTVHSADARVVLGRVQGEVVIKARDGSIDLGRGCTGSAELRTVRGSIAAANVDDSLRAYTSGGDIRLAACKGDVYAQTSGGGIHVESIGGQTLAFSSGGDVVVRVPSVPTANCRFGAADGNVELVVNRGLAIEIAARGQEVDLPFAFRPEAASDGTDKPWLVSRLNGGGQRIRAASTAGKVTVRALAGQGQLATGGSGQGQGGSGSGGSAQGSSGSDGSGQTGSGQTGSGLGGSGLGGSGRGRSGQAASGLGGSGLGGSGLGGSGLGGSGQVGSGLGGSGLGGSSSGGSGLGGSGSGGGSASAGDRPARSSLATEPTPGRFAVVELPGGGAMDGYAIYLPRSHAATSEPVPVLVYLQGGFGVGGPIGDVINWGLARLVRDETDLSIARNQLLLDRFIVVCPHIREGQYHDDPEAMRSILVDVIDKHRGDPSRVYLTGLSRGGHGTWGLAARLRGTFAAIAPIGGRHEGFDDWSVFDGPAIWLSHNRGDGVVPFSSTATAVEQLEGELGVDFRRFDTLLVEGTDYLSRAYILTAPLSDTHDAWTDLYSNAPFYRWLLEHRRRPPAPERRIR